jgi:type I restriction enzyme S subunit
VKIFKLKDVCKLVGGGTPSKANKHFYTGDIPWASVRDLRSRWVEDTELHITDFAVKESSTNVIPAGNVVIASRVGLGKVVQVRNDTAINQDLRALIPIDPNTLNVNFLYYWALSIAPKIVSAGKGATVQGVTLPFLENLEIPVPDMDIQVQIANNLDQAFLEIDELNGKTELKISLLNQLYDQELENLLRKNVNNWPITNIEDSCDFKNGKAHEQLVSKNGKYRLVTSKFVSSNGEQARLVTEALTPLEKGDVAFVLSDLPNGRALAKAFLVREEKDLTLNQRVLRVRSDKFDPTFLYLQINRHPYLLSFDNGESQTHLKLAQVLACPLLIPELSIQEAVSKRLIKLRHLIQETENSLKRKIALHEDLRISFLYDAFNRFTAKDKVA